MRSPLAHLVPRISAAALLFAVAVPVEAQANPASSFGIEWAGGSAGSAVGIGVGLMLMHPQRCGEDDVGCVLERLAGIGLMTAATAPLGAWGAGSAWETGPHAAGAAIGGVLGVAAGVGALRLLSEVGVEPRGAAAVVVYVVAQGLATGVGSRIGAGMRDD